VILKKDNPLAQCEIKMIDAVGDTIAKGAYLDTLKNERAPSMFVNHDSFQVPIGDWKHLEEDSTGLLVVGKVDLNHKDGPTVHSALERGAMDAMSIGFQIFPGGSEEKDDGTRLLKAIDLKEISIVNFPADDSARIAIVKADINSIVTLKEMEMLLRDAGYSKSAATAYVSRMKFILRSDSDAQTDEITGLNVTDAIVALFK